MIEIKPDQFVLGVDLGGTKTGIALVSLDGMIHQRYVEPTLQTGSDAGIAQIIRLLRRAIDQSELAPGSIHGIGVGIPAMIDHKTGLVLWGPNLPGWHNVALKAMLEDALDMHVCIEYDGHTAVLAEWWQGAAKGFRCVAEVIIGTGIGGGLILDGQLIRGMNNMAGAVGWFPMTRHDADFDASIRSSGHWDSLAGGPGIVRRAQEMLAGYPDSQLTPFSGHLTAKDIFDADVDGDSLARRIVDDTADLIGLGVASIVSLVNPEIVILGGGIGAQRGERLIPRVSEVVRRWGQPISSESVVIAASRLGADGGVLGAAYAVINQLQPQVL